LRLNLFLLLKTWTFWRGEEVSWQAGIIEVLLGHSTGQFLNYDAGFPMENLSFHGNQSVRVNAFSFKYCSHILKRDKDGEC
jgi:hypothetical protein